MAVVVDMGVEGVGGTLPAGVGAMVGGTLPLGAMGVGMGGVGVTALAPALASAAKQHPFSAPVPIGPCLPSLPSFLFFLSMLPWSVPSCVCPGERE